MTAYLGIIVFPTLLERGRVGTVSYGTSYQYHAADRHQLSLGAQSEVHQIVAFTIVGVGQSEAVVRSDRRGPGFVQQVGKLRCLSLGPPILRSIRTGDCKICFKTLSCYPARFHTVADWRVSGRR
jgi:hypothetical protein